MLKSCQIFCCGPKRSLAPLPDDGFEKALEEVTQRNNHIRPWMWWIFYLAGIPGVINAWHLTLIVFVRFEQPYWCKVPELDSTGWSKEQLQKISAPRDSDGSVIVRTCEKLNLNYRELASLPKFEDALKQVEANISAAKPGKLGTSSCTEYYFLGSGQESQWSLVCDQTKLVMRTNLQSAVAAGKLAGSFVFGFIADRCGRKLVFVMSCFIYIVSSITSSFTNDYWVYVFMRFGTGMSGAGTFNVAFTIMAECCHPSQRTLLGNLYNLFYPLGLCSLPLIAYFCQEDWHYLQMALSFPTLLLLINCWFIPESPRWLISQGRREEAWKVVQDGSWGQITPPPPQPPPPPTAVEAEQQDERSWWAKKKETSQLLKLLSSCDLVVRLMLCHYGWFAVALSYYTLSLSSDNLKMDRFPYIALLGLVEAVSYCVCVPILKVLGRRLCCSIMFCLSAAMLLPLVLLPPDSLTVRFVMAMIGAWTVTIVYSVIILFTGELFPTDNRNTAVGTSAVLSHISGIISPFIVDFLGAIAWYFPSILCGSLLLIAGFLMLLLPETRDKLLDDTIQQVRDNPKNRVSFKNCCALNS